eukprot:5404351-Prymnesium_polylepis.2
MLNHNLIPSRARFHRQSGLTNGFANGPTLISTSLCVSPTVSPMVSPSRGAGERATMLVSRRLTLDHRVDPPRRAGSVSPG